jgi:hypothetical protein
VLFYERYEELLIQELIDELKDWNIVFIPNNFPFKIELIVFTWIILILCNKISW